MITAFAIINLTLAINLYLHYRRWLERNTGIRVNHLKSAAVRSVGFIIAAIFILEFPKVIAGTIFHACYFWLLFDGLYNIVRNYPFWQIGTVEKDEAKTDNLLRRVTPVQHKILKIGLVLASALVYAVTIKYQ